mmetsp:Transcript_16391/g.23104  ORF Transcript_16391/g.23104 Transcript_16391/m.23104 type:complete len:412 (+) Transcript_16391:196-1431(+)
MTLKAELEPNHGLKNCRILLLGFCGVENQPLIKASRCSLATRFTRYNDSITHVVMGNSKLVDEKLLKKIKERESDNVLRVVCADWLLESCKVGYPLPSQNFPPKDPSLKNQEKKATKTLFGQIQFTIKDECFSYKIKKMLETKILQFGGKICSPFTKANNENTVNYALCSLNHRFKPFGDLLVAVTPLWLDACILQNELYSPRSWVLFTPKPDLPLPKFELRDHFVICFTQIEGARRAGLMAAVNFAGASISRELNGKVTHLICGKPEGPKYEASKKLKCHAVSKHWLLNCIYKGYIEGSERNYPAEKIQAKKMTLKRNTENKMSSFEMAVIAAKMKVEENFMKRENEKSDDRMMIGGSNENNKRKVLGDIGNNRPIEKKKILRMRIGDENANEVFNKERKDILNNITMWS